MALVNFTNVLAFDNVNKEITFTDTTDYSAYPAAVISVQVTDPLGTSYTQNLSLPTNDYTFSPVLDTEGEMIRGVYEVFVSAVEGPTDLGEDTSTLNFKYTPPEVDVDITVDCITPSLTSTDNTNYTVNGQNPSSIAYNHTLQYPPSTGEADIVDTNPTIVTGTFYTVKDVGLQHSSTMETTLTYDFGTWTVDDVVEGTGFADVYCDNDLCDVYCCIRSQWTTLQNAKCESKTEEEKAKKALYEMVINSYLLKNAMECGKADDISGYLEQIKKIGNCSGDCGCDDGEPILVTGLGGVVAPGGGGATSVVVSGGLPIIVTSNTVGTVTTYTVSLDPSYGASDISILDTAACFVSTNVEDALAELCSNLNDLTTAVGVSPGDTDMGTFTGTTIPDNVTAKAALQALETLAESIGSGSTNLSFTPGASSFTLGSDTGTDAVVLGATGSDAGAMTASDKTKIDYISITGSVDLDFLGANTKNHNYSASAAPGFSDDASAGYSVGSFWYDTNNDDVYTCLDATNGAAVWGQIDVQAIGSGTTNLSYVAASSQGTVESDTGTDAVIPLATTSLAGLHSPTDKTKIDFMAVSGAVSIDFLDVNTVKNNFSALASPDITDDTSSGYEVGSFWFNTNSNDVWACLDNTAGAAVWIDLTAVAAGSATDLAYVASPTNGTVTSSTGTDATLTLADSTDAGLMSPDQNDKVDFLTVTGSTDLDFISPNVKKSNFAAVVAPGVSDDDTAGYAVGSFWHDITGVESYVCLSAATGAAVWENITTLGAAGSTNLAYTPSPTDGTVTSDTGTDATLTLADSTNAGLMDPGQHDKVDFLTVTGAVDLDFISPNVKKSNFAAVVAPTVSDDSTAGYEIGSFWHDSTGVESYVCLSASAGAAVWENITTSGAGGSTNLAYTPSPTDGTVTSDTGTDATVTLADSVNAGLMSPGQNDKVDFLTVTGAADVDFLVANTQLKNNAAAVAPAVSDDSASGYAVGSQWNDTTADESYVCLDASVGAAVWKQTTASGVSSVNGDSGPAVVLDADDISDAATTNKWTTTSDQTNWNTAFGWGDHSVAGYVTGNFVTSDLTFTANRSHDLAGFDLTFDNGEVLVQGNTNTNAESAFTVRSADGTQLLRLRNDGTGAWGTSAPVTTADFNLVGINSNTTMALSSSVASQTLSVINTKSNGAGIVLNATGASAFSIAILDGPAVFRSGANLTCGQNSPDADSQIFATNSGSGRTYSLQALDQSHTEILKVGLAGANNASAALEVDSVTGGILFPRMNVTEAGAITPVNGLTIYVTNTDATFTSIGFWGYEGGAWVKL